MISNKEMGKKLITEAGAVILVSATIDENATVYAKGGGGRGACKDAGEEII